VESSGRRCPSDDLARRIGLAEDVADAITFATFADVMTRTDSGRP
jgi:hypothetical protein